MFSAATKLPFLGKNPRILSKLRDVMRSTYRNHTAYEGDGKTKATVLNQEHDLGLMINSYSQFGFRLNNDMVILGPVAIFPNSVLSWNVNSHDDINEDSLSLFYTVEPKLDVLILGIGDQTVTPEFSKKIIEFMKKYRINTEILRTEQACATFNFLNAESRMVAAGIIPPQHLATTEEDLMRTQIRKGDLYRVDDEK